VTCGWKSAKGPCMDRTRRAVSLYRAVKIKEADPLHKDRPLFVFGEC
jgi:hypothetical protein